MIDLNGWLPLRGLEMPRTLIRAGWIATLDPQLGNLRDAEIIVSGGRIDAIGKDLNATVDETIDARDMIVMPGLVNAHMHTWQTGFRGIGGEWMYQDYFRAMHGNMATMFGPEDNYLGNLIGALNQIDGGVTTLVDWCHNLTSMEQAERSVDGLADSGIRAVFVHGNAKSTDPGAPHYSLVPHPKDRIEALRKGRMGSDDQLVTLAMGMSGPGDSVWDVVEQDLALARELNVVASAHSYRNDISINPRGFLRMARGGLLGPDVNVVHGLNFDDEEMRAIVESGASLTSTVIVELHHHVADPIVWRVRAMGGLPSIGIDVEAYVTGHQFREMQAALLFARSCENRRNVLLGNAPHSRMQIRSHEALEWSTVAGAKAFRLEHKIGSLSVGKRADIVMLRATDLNLFPVYNPVLSIVEQAGPGNVDTVMIDGVVRKRHGKLLFEPATLRQRLDQLARSAARMMERAGLDAEFRTTKLPEHLQQRSR